MALPQGGPLAHRLDRNVDEIMDKCCAAWHSLVDEPGRIPQPLFPCLADGQACACVGLFVRHATER